jgi:hypothetical protein
VGCLDNREKRRFRLLQTVEIVCRRTMRRLATPKNLGFLGCRSSGKRPWRAFSTGSWTVNARVHLCFSRQDASTNALKRPEKVSAAKHVLGRAFWGMSPADFVSLLFSSRFNGRHDLLGNGPIDRSFLPNQRLEVFDRFEDFARRTARACHVGGSNSSGCTG